MFIEIMLNFAVIPDPPQTLAVDSKGSRMANVSWMAGFDGNSAIQNYTVEISEDNRAFGDVMCHRSLLNGSCVVSSTSASLTGLFPATTYYIRVFATNPVGSGSSSVAIVTTDEEGALWLFKIY